MSVLTIIYFGLGRVFAPAVQPVYPRAPGNRPGTNLQKALEEWRAVCHMAGGLCESIYLAQKKNNTGLCVVIWGTPWVETDSVSAQMRRHRRQGSPLVAFSSTHHFSAGAR